MAAECQCHGHAHSCHFSQRAWLSSGGTSGGVCDNCQHNTVGRRCQRCRHGYHRRPSVPLSSPHACKRKRRGNNRGHERSFLAVKVDVAVCFAGCWCDPRGSLPPHPGKGSTWCHPRSGQCRCKSGVGGADCSQCLPGFWGFSEEGCRPCSCPHVCNPTTGHCSARLATCLSHDHIPKIS